MNVDQILGVFRTVLTAVIAYLAGKGLIPANIVPTELVAAIVTIAVAIWSFVDKTARATVSKAAAIVTISPVAQASVGITVPIPVAPKL